MNPQEKARIERSQDRMVNAMERAVLLNRLAAQILARRKAAKAAQ